MRRINVLDFIQAVDSLLEHLVSQTLNMVFLINIESLNLFEVLDVVLSPIYRIRLWQNLLRVGGKPSGFLKSEHWFLF